MRLSVRFLLVALLAFCAGVLTQPAFAQAKLDAEYTAYLAGLPVGKGTWTLEIDDTHFTSAAGGGTSGLIRVISSGHGSSTAQGNFSGTSSYSAAIKTSSKSDEVQLTIANGAVKDVKIDPPADAPPDPDRVPVTDAMRQGVTDPMTASLIRMPAAGELVSADACTRSASIFDGRLRYDLRLAFKRMEKVKATKGYVGPAVVCSIYFIPIGGHIPSRTAVKYLTGQRDMEVWLVPVSGTRVLVPFRFQVPTPIGLAALEADQFVAVAQPSRTATKGVKTQ